MSAPQHHPMNSFDFFADRNAEVIATYEAKKNAPTSLTNSYASLRLFRMTATTTAATTAIASNARAT